MLYYQFGFSFDLMGKLQCQGCVDTSVLNTISFSLSLTTIIAAERLLYGCRRMVACYTELKYFTSSRNTNVDTQVDPSLLTSGHTQTTATHFPAAYSHNQLNRHVVV